MKLLRITLIALFAWTLCSATYHDATAEARVADEPAKLSLKFMVRSADGKTYQNALVSVAASEEDLSENRYIDKKRTDNEGKADFGRFDSGTYYYEAEVYDGTLLLKDGVVRLSTGKDNWQEIIMQ